MLSHLIREGTLTMKPANSDGTFRSKGEEQITEASLAGTDVARCSLHRLRLMTDARGDLSVGEFERDIPFAPKRYFLVFNVPEGEARGNHAHKLCHQFLICVRGSCHLRLDDGQHRRELTLDRPDLGVYLPPMIWGVQHTYSADAALLVFASEFYDADDYIRSYEQFCELKAGRKSTPKR
jgi:hypothetical protein